MQLEGDGQPWAQGTCGAAGEHARELRFAGRVQVVEPLDGSGLRMLATAGDGVDGLRRIVDVFSVGVGQRGCVFVQRAQHEADAGQDHAALELSRGGDEPDRATDVADVAFIGGAITIGALLGALVYKVGSVPLTLSTSGGVLIAGLFFGWLRSVRPTFGRIPSSTVWFMNSVGLNVFIAVVGISSGPGFVAGLQQLGFSLFLWGVVVTTVPLILAMYLGKYLFRFDDAIVLGCCSGARTTTASLGMINDRARSQIPGLGYTVTYAVGNTLLTVWGMVLVMLLT